MKNKLFFFTDWEYNPIGQTAIRIPVLRADLGGLFDVGTLFPGNTNLRTVPEVRPAGGAANVCCSSITVAQGVRP